MLAFGVPLFHYPSRRSALVLRIKNGGPYGITRRFSRGRACCPDLLILGTVLPEFVKAKCLSTWNFTRSAAFRYLHSMIVPIPGPVSNLYAPVGMSARTVVSIKSRPLVWWTIAPVI